MNWRSPVAIATALVALLLVAGVVVLTAMRFRGTQEPQAPAQADAGPTVAEHKGDGSDDFGWVMTAMAECQEEAKLKTDLWHFLIIPVTRTGTAPAHWSPVPITSVGKFAILLTWSDTLIGLRSRALALYPKPVGFAVTDPVSGTSYKWKPSVGVTSLKARGVDTDSLKLGLDIAEVSEETAWGPVIEHMKGSCHWINALIRPPPRTPATR